MSRRYYHFIALGFVNFYLSGKWYQYKPGDIFSETEDRAERILETQYAHNLRVTAKDPEPAPEQETSEVELYHEQDSAEEKEEEGSSLTPFSDAEATTDSPSEQVEIEVTDEDHWKTVEKYLEGLLQEDPVPEEKVNLVCERYGGENGYKTVRKLCQAYFHPET